MKSAVYPRTEIRQNSPEQPRAAEFLRNSREYPRNSENAYFTLLMHSAFQDRMCLISRASYVRRPPRFSDCVKHQQARYAFAPTGNSAEKELVLSAEYFSRNEDGILNLYVDNPNEPGYVDTATSAESDDFAWSDIDSSGYYASAVYKINPKMRGGYRYSKMNSPDVPSAFAAAHEGEFDPAGFDPVATAYMIDWNHSDHSLIRFQINQEELANGQEDDQFIVQYIMNL